MSKIFTLKSSQYTEIQKVAAAALVAGELVTLQEVNGFPLVDVAIGETYSLITKAEKVSCAKTTAAILAGDAVYHVTATDNVAIAGNTLIGYAAEDAGAGTTEVLVVFDGMSAFEKL